MYVRESSLVLSYTKLEERTAISLMTTIKRQDKSIENVLEKFKLNMAYWPIVLEPCRGCIDQTVWQLAGLGQWVSAQSRHSGRYWGKWDRPEFQSENLWMTIRDTQWLYYKSHWGTLPLKETFKTRYSYVLVSNFRKTISFMDVYADFCRFWHDLHIILYGEPSVKRSTIVTSYPYTSHASEWMKHGLDKTLVHIPISNHDLKYILPSQFCNACLG